MACKFLVAILRPWLLFPKLQTISKKIVLPQVMTVRTAGGLIPPNQYDVPYPKKMKIGVVLRKNWEVIPLFATTATAITIMTCAIIWSVFNKVDVVFQTHSRRNISHTMNLLQPTTHKFIVINQTYDSWPEMYSVLEKMKREQCRRHDKKKQGSAC